MTHIDPSFFDSFANRGGALLDLWMMIRKDNRCNHAICADVRGENCVCGDQFRSELARIDARSGETRQGLDPVGTKAGIAPNSLNTGKNITPETGGA